MAGSRDDSAKEEEATDAVKVMKEEEGERGDKLSC